MTAFTQDDDALLEELGVEAETKRTRKRTAREERIIAGFEEIQRFFEDNELAPQHGENRECTEPAKREAGIIVESVAELVEKLRTEAGVI